MLISLKQKRNASFRKYRSAARVAGRLWAKYPGRFANIQSRMESRYWVRCVERNAE